MNIGQCIRLTLIMVALYDVAGSTELLAAKADHGPHGLFNWLEWRTRFIPISALSPKLWAAKLIPASAIQALNCGRLCLTLAALAWRQPWPVLLWLLFSFDTALDFRIGQFGRDGSDSMHRIVLLALCILSSYKSPWAQQAGICFIAGQAMLAYLMAGLVKIVSPQWRSGEAMRIVFSNPKFGAPKVGALLIKSSRVTTAAAWFVILFECLLPISVLIGPNVLAVFLTLALLFHLAVAAGIGLGAFVWSFPATYPSLLFVSMLLRQAHPGVMK